MWILLWMQTKKQWGGQTHQDLVKLSALQWDPIRGSPLAKLREEFKMLFTGRHVKQWHKSSDMLRVLFWSDDESEVAVIHLDTHPVGSGKCQPLYRTSKIITSQNVRNTGCNNLISFLFFKKKHISHFTKVFSLQVKQANYGKTWRPIKILYISIRSIACIYCEKENMISSVHWSAVCQITMPRCAISSCSSCYARKHVYFFSLPVRCLCSLACRSV